MTKLGYLVFCNRGRCSQLDPRELLDELAAIEVEIVEEIEALRDVMNMTTVRQPGLKKIQHGILGLHIALR